MARRPTLQAPHSPNLSPAEKRSAIGRLSRRIEDLRNFDPQSVQARRSPEVMKLEAAIKETLAAAFGYGTDRYNRYSSAADLEPTVIGVLYLAGGRRPRGENIGELRMKIAERKQRAIALLQTAVQGLEEEFVPEPEPSGARAAPTSDDGMSDAALAEIRDGIAEIKHQLPAIVTSNAVKAEIQSDLTQIDTELERPTPRRKFLKTFLESLRDNLAKAAATGLIAIIAGILAKSFHVF